MNKQLQFFFVAFITLVIAACSSNDEVKQPSNVNLPQWVFQPKIDNGVAAAQCVKFSGNISLDQQEVTAKGRASLAQQIDLRAQVMDKVYQSRTEAEGKAVSGSVFENVSKQVTDQNLTGSKLTRTEFGTVNKEQYICGLVSITQDETKKIFDSIVNDKSAPKVSAQDQDILFQEFKAYKAQQELGQAIGQAN